MIEQLTKEQAIAFGEKGLYKDMSFEEIASFQIQQDLLCMPFDIFHEAVEKTLGRPVWTHEFGLNRQGLMDEILNGAKHPSFNDILNLLVK